MANVLPDPPRVSEEFDPGHEWEEWFARVSEHIRVFQTTVDPPSLATNSGDDSTVTVNGLSTQDFVNVHVTSTLADGYFIQNAFVSAVNTLTIEWFNGGTGTTDPGVVTLRIIAIRPIT